MRPTDPLTVHNLSFGQVIEVSPTFYRGPRPAKLEELVSLGIKTIINWEVGYFEWWHHEVKQEQEMCKAAGIQYIHDPYGDIFSPYMGQLRNTFALIKQAEKFGPVYGHCLHGKDRTGLNSGIYRVKAQGWSCDDAMDEMIKLGFHEMPYAYLGWLGRFKETCNTTWVGPSEGTK